MTTPIERLRTALSGRYEVEHELGRGGMAVVCLGQDLRRPSGFCVVRVAAQLQHPVKPRS